MLIAFIGVGIMGRGMVRNLCRAGYQVQIYSRTRSKLEDFITHMQIPFSESVADCVKDADVVITMVGFPKDVEDVYFGKEGILKQVKSGAYLIDMTTTDPRLSQEIFDKAAKKELHALDAPVSGGESGAENGTLSIMVGGEEEDFNVMHPIFEAMGETIIYEGPAGCGQHTKMANQIAIAGAMAGVCEALTYAENAGLDPKKMYDSISRGAAASQQMTNFCPKMIAHDYRPSFYMKHFIKDLNIAVSQEVAELPVLSQVLSEYRELLLEGDGDQGTQALIRWYTEEKKE